jgi:hypothetical protein
MKRPGAPLVLSSLALLVALSGTGIAAKGLITSKDIKDGTIQVKDLSPAAIKALKGRRGPRGIHGLQGSQGPQGPQGPAGGFDPAKVKPFNSATKSVPGFTTVNFTAECPAGNVVISGGFKVNSGALRPVTEQPLLFRTPNAYSVDLYNESSSPAGSALAFAICAAP